MRHGHSIEGRGSMSTATSPMGSPFSDPRAERLPFALLGYSIAAAAIFLAWLWAAGVETSPSNFDSGPTPSTLLLLGVSIGVLVLGAAIVAVYGSVYGNTPGAAPGATSAGTLGSTRNVGRVAVFLVVLGAGLLLMGLALPVANLGISHALLPLYISPSVLFVPEAVDGIALATLALGVSLFVLERKHYRSEFHAWWRHVGQHLTVTSVTILVIVAALLLVPVHQSFSTQLSISGGQGGGISFEEFPAAGIQVTGSWSASPAGLVNFTIQDTSGATIYTVNASSGTFSFVTSGVPWPLYTFWGHSLSSETVTVSGSYNAPIWSWPPGEPGRPT
jgi:hypothetical protein